MNANDTGEPRIIQVGADRVTIGPQQVMIDARRAMPDWQVREFKPAPIYFEDREYRLIARQPAEKPFAIRYGLEPGSLVIANRGGRTSGCPIIGRA